MSSVAEQAKARLAALAARRAGATPIATSPATAPVEAAAALPPSDASVPPTSKESLSQSTGPSPDESAEEQRSDAQERPTSVDTAVVAGETSEPTTDSAVSVTGEKKRGRPKGSRNAPPSAPPGAGINPPEVSVALAAIAVDPLAGSKGAAPAPLPSLLQDAARDPILVARALAALLPVGISMTVTGVGK
jgi:hypothetical protein